MEKGIAEHPKVAYYDSGSTHLVFYYRMNLSNFEEEFLGCGLVTDDYESLGDYDDKVFTSIHQRLGKVVVDDLTFYRLDHSISYALKNGSFNWTEHSIGLLLKKNDASSESWEKNADWLSLYFQGDREVTEGVIEDKTFYIETPARIDERKEELEKQREEMSELIGYSQMGVIGLIVMLVAYHIMEKRREGSRWSED